MNRLRDETGSDPTLARGVKLLRSLGPRENVPEMKERVWAAVLRNRRLAHPSSSRRSAPLRRRPAFLAGLLLLSAATAAAMIGRGVIEHKTSWGPTKPPANKPVPQANQQSFNRPPVQQAAPSAVAVAPAPALPRAEPRRPGGRTNRAPASRRVSLASVSERSTQEGRLLLDAMIALRRDGDSQRAGELLDRVLNEFPHSALREESLALSVEAAIARNDSAARDRWARAYLQAYPSGRFRDFVNSSLAGP